MAKTKRICSIPDCGKRHKGRGWCNIHYKRWLLHGDPLGGSTFRGEVTRYLNEVVLTYEGNECLPWPYSKVKGRGQIVIEGKSQFVARLACAAAHGPAPTPGHEAAHSCGNGHLSCCTKAHLRWATRSENIMDRVIHGTHIRGERCTWTKLTESNVREIRSSLKNGVSQGQLAKLFGVRQETIWAIHHRVSWAWLT